MIELVLRYEKQQETLVMVSCQVVYENLGKWHTGHMVATDISDWGARKVHMKNKMLSN